MGIAVSLPSSPGPCVSAVVAEREEVLTSGSFCLVTSEPMIPGLLFPEIGGDDSQNPSPLSLTTAPPTPVPLLTASLSCPLLPASCLHFSPLGSLIPPRREATTAALGRRRGQPLPPQSPVSLPQPLQVAPRPPAQKQPKCPLPGFLRAGQSGAGSRRPEGPVSPAAGGARGVFAPSLSTSV